MHGLAECQNALRLYRAYLDAMDAYLCGFYAGIDAAALDELAEEMNEAERVYEDCGVELDCDFADEPMICDRTGIPLVVGDTRIIDATRNRVYLRHSLEELGA